MSATREWARLAASITADEVPQAVRDRLRVLLLDQVGAQLAGSTRRWNAEVRGYALDQTRPGASSVVAGGSAAPEWAAFANATAGHGFEIDDYHAAALAHPGCVAVPATLAVAEDLDADSEQVIVALALGFEAIIRLGLATQPSMIFDRGFHETCAQGVFGAALAAGRLAGLDADTLASALGIAGSHASGTTEYSQSGGEVKRLHAGLGAMGGLRAVTLAQRGIPGPPTILEGRRGFLQAFAQTAQAERLTADLGDRWELLDTAIKPYFSCALTHAPIAALERLIEEERLRADEVTSIEVGCDELSLVHVGSIGPKPRDMTGAQFSLEYSLAMQLVLGANDFGAYSRAEEANYDLPEVSQIAERVTLVRDAEAEAHFPERFVARVRVQRSDGTTVERRADAPGSPAAPASDEAIRAKFRSIATTIIGSERAGRTEEAVDRLFEGGPVRDVLAAVR